MATEEDNGKIIKHLGKVLPIQHVSHADAVSEVNKSDMGEGTADAYKTLRKARSDARLVGVREKREKAKVDEASASKK